MSEWETVEENGYHYRFQSGSGPVYIRHDSHPEWQQLLQPSPHATERRIMGVHRKMEGPVTWRLTGGAWVIQRVQSQQDRGPAESTETEGPDLWLIRERQAPGEPDHWSLCVAHEGRAGSVYSVTGDAEFMVYRPGQSNLFISESFKDAYKMAPNLSEAQQASVKAIADAEPPPRAASGAEV